MMDRHKYHGTLFRLDTMVVDMNSWSGGLSGSAANLLGSPIYGQLKNRASWTTLFKVLHPETVEREE